MPQHSALPSSTPDLRHVLDATLAAAPCVIPYTQFPKNTIVLYGGGRLGKMAFALLKKSGYQVSHVIDQNATRLAADFPVPVLTLEEAAKTLPRDAYIFDCVFKQQLYMAKSRLAPLGFGNIYTIYDLLFAIPSLHFTNGWQSGALSDADKRGITAVYDVLADDASRATYIANVAWRISRNPPLMPQFALIAEDDKYWNAITRQPFLAGKHFIDAGAFDLFFTLQSLNPKWNPYAPAGVLALEPDPESLLRCKKIVAEESAAAQKFITLSPQAVSEHAGKTQLIGGNDLSSKLVYGAALSGEETMVDCESTTLDALGEQLPSIGYIKLHVEGEELPCVRGGLKCIARHRPIVVVNCSHNREGLWELPHALIENAENYRYYFRAHAHYGEGLTFYAVPQ